MAGEYGGHYGAVLPRGGGSRGRDKGASCNDQYYESCHSHRKQKQERRDMDWKLTDEEILAKSTDQFEYCELALEIGKWARDEQAKKLVEKADETGLLKHDDVWTKSLDAETCRWVCLPNCRVCELRSQVGLE